MELELRARGWNSGQGTVAFSGRHKVTSQPGDPTPRKRRTRLGPRGERGGATAGGGGATTASAGPGGPTALALPRPLARRPMGLRDTPLTTRSPPPGDAPRRIRNPPGCWRVQGPAGVWGPAARRHEANAEDGPVTGQGLGAAQRAETQLLVRSRSWAVPAARTPALGPPPPPSGDSVLGWGPTPGTLSLR